MSNLHAFDLLFIAVYFMILFGIAWWAALREKNVSSDYFLASRDVAWFAVGASLFASNIGSEHLVGLAGTGAGSGLAVANDAYASPAVWEMFARDLYHSPRVVWGREVNVLLAALARRHHPAAVDSVRHAVASSGLQYAELWSYKMDGGSVHAVRYGASSDVQLWTLTDLAVQYLLNSPRPTQ